MPRKGTHKAAGLNDRQQAFVTEYIKDKNATNAYMRAYGATKVTAMRSGPRLLDHVGVRSEIDRILSETRQKAQVETGITLARTLKEIERIAFFDPRRMFDEDGRPKAIHELDDETAAVVAGLDVLEEYDRDGEQRVLRGYVKKWKLSEKRGALDMLMKHLGGYEVDNKQKGEAEAAAAAMSMEEAARRMAYLLQAGMVKGKP